MTQQPGTIVTKMYKRVCIKKPEDRLTLVKILADNDYTVRIIRERRNKGTTYDYFVEFWPNRKTEGAGNADEG